MSKKRVYGPKAFLVTLGLVVFFLGLLILLAIPAANIMNDKAVADGEARVDQKRVTKIMVQARIALGTGTGLTLLGFGLGWRKARQISQK